MGFQKYPKHRPEYLIKSFYWNSLLRYTRNRVMIRPILVSPISPVPHYGNRPKLVSLESYDHGESNAVGCKDFGSELAEDVGIYRETIKGAQIRNIGAFLSWKLLSSSSSSFAATPPLVLGRFQWCLGWFWSGKPGLGSVLSRGRSVSLWNKLLWLYLVRQRLETEVKGQGLCMLAALMGHFLIFWLESLYVGNQSYFLPKTPPSFAAVSQWSQTSPERAFCAILE